MDMQATILILAWGGVASVLLFVLQGLIKQVHELLITLRPLLQSLRKWSRSRRREREAARRVAPRRGRRE
ncbi:hypothetical protein [Streptomyces yangpuensis]|uniref:hypothetical protein n=1 Tax=Streptomyces yangpuensis TaxID=1648182 RepID=UPI0037FB755F